MQEFVCGAIVAIVSAVLALELNKRLRAKQNKQILSVMVTLIKAMEESIVARLSGSNSSKSVSERLAKVQKLADQQLDMLATMKQPSKNALHSQYKNQLGSEIRKIEDEKLAVLKSILDDGNDPLIAIKLNSDKIEHVRLSKYLNTHAKRQNSKSTSSDNNNDKEPRKIGTFTVYKGGNNEDEQQ